MSGEETRDATINAVAAVILAEGDMTGRYSDPTGEARYIARELAEAGWLKDPADRVLTPTDQAVLDAAERWADAPDAYVKAIYGGDLYDAVLARRAAVGGSVPADPKEQP